MIEKARGYIKKLDDIERNLGHSSMNKEELEREKLAIKGYKSALAKFNTFGPETQEIILENVEMYLARIKKVIESSYSA